MHILKRIILLCAFLLPVSIEPISRQQRRSTASYLNLRRIQKARSPRATRTRGRPTSLKLRRAGQPQRPGRSQQRAQRRAQPQRKAQRPRQTRRQPQKKAGRQQQPRRAPGRPLLRQGFRLRQGYVGQAYGQAAPITPIIPPVIIPPQQPPTFIPAPLLRQGYEGQEPSIKWIHWQMPLGGAIIDGRQYTQHALERMAPDIEQVRTELQTRAITRGYQPGSREFNNYIKPRDIPPATVEYIIATTMPYPGKQPNTLVHETQDFRVVLGTNGTVVTVIEKE